VALRRLLRYLNFAIAAFLVAALAAVYWCAWRPLPRASGSVRGPVSARAVIVRDTRGMAHIEAGSLEDVFFLQGYAAAQDRMFQMDLLRRTAAGELAEVAGAAALAADQEARRMRLRRLAEDCAARLTPGDRAMLAAYARGVNHYLDASRGRLPLEFSLLRYDPRPWSVVDSVLVVLSLRNSLERSWRSELRKEEMLAAGDRARVEFLYSLRPGGEARGASNAWAVSGGRTASGLPLLAADPHLEFTMPSLWRLDHLKGPGLNVAGASIPGIPAVMAGHNEHIAWSLASAPFDVQDLYAEKLDAAAGRYVFAGRVEQARLERELVRVRDGAPRTLLIWVTRHGPVLLPEKGRFLSLRWTAAETAGFRLPLIELNRARNWQDFRAALSQSPGPCMNFIYADRAGNIGSQVAGLVPLRVGFDGGVPLDGASGAFEWRGFLPFDQLPSTFNPSSGLVVYANGDPFPQGASAAVPGGFHSPYRERRIRARIESRRNWTAGDMLSIQTDVYSSFSHFLARQVLAACARHGHERPALGPAAEILRRWDGRMEADAAAPMLAELLYQHLRTAIGNRASPGRGLLYQSRSAATAVERLLAERPAGWFDDYDRLLLDCLQDAIDEGRRMQGQDLARWRYGRMNLLHLRNRVAGQLPLVGKYFNAGPQPMSGSSETVNMILREEQLIGPSMRMIIDLGDFDRSQAVLTLGQSGQVLSRHYKDHWRAYIEGRGLPMPFYKVEGKETLVFMPEAD